jgi:ADP-ribose pyrophosphatase
VSDYQLIASKLLFDHAWVQVIQDTLRYQDQTIQYYYLASPVEAVATVGVTKDDEIILTRQYRHPVGKTIYDLPAGRLNPGEDPLEGARREFEEETGFYPNNIVPLGYYNQFPGSLRAATHLFFAFDLVSTQQRLDDGELLDIELKPLDAVLEMILRGELIDGSLQLGVLLALFKGYLTRGVDHGVS